MNCFNLSKEPRTKKIKWQNICCVEHFKDWSKLNALILVRSVTTECELLLGTTCVCVYSYLLFVDFSLRTELSFCRGEWWIRWVLLVYITNIKKLMCVQVLRSPKEAFAAAMQSWRERCEKCACLQGDYVEK